MFDFKRVIKIESTTEFQVNCKSYVDCLAFINLAILRTWADVNPNYGRGLSIKDCEKAVAWLDDAIALLKAQEPRVLALDEIHRGMAVWLEDVDKADVILAIGGSSGGGCKCFITVNDRAIAPHDSDYGARWRAWTREPTQEQREAVAWNG